MTLGTWDDETEDDRCRAEERADEDRALRREQEQDERRCG